MHAHKIIQLNWNDGSDNTVAATAADEFSGLIATG